MSPRRKITWIPVTIRFPADLHEKLKDAGGESPQTPFNTLVVSLLYDALKSQEPASLDARYEAASDAYMRLIRELQQRISNLEAELQKHKK